MDKSEGKKKRRSKADNEGRAYSCECGKSYFSYQALYTHKKTKHSDNVIEEEAPKKKRGRPRIHKHTSEEESQAESIPQDDPISEKMILLANNEGNGTCDEVFAEYLLFKQNNNLTEKEYATIKNSIYSLRDCVNKSYEKLDPNNFLENDVDYTISEKPAMIPNICNFYIIEYLPKEKPSYDKEKEIQFMLDFCKWLNEKNYTELEIAISP